MFDLTKQEIIAALKKEFGSDNALRDHEADFRFAHAVLAAAWDKIPAGCTPDNAMRLHAHINEAHAQIQAMARGRDQAYVERNRLVRFVASLFPSGIRKTEIEGWDPEWHNCVFIDTPEGQMSWHYHDSDAEMFASLPPYLQPWDGHTTAQKYERLARIVAMAESDDVRTWSKQLAQQEPVEAPKKHCAHCNAVLDTPVNVQGPYTPKEGDAAFCFYCGNVSMFTDDAEAPLRVPNEPELEALSHNEGLLRMRDIWLAQQAPQQKVH